MGAGRSEPTEDLLVQDPGSSGREGAAGELQLRGSLDPNPPPQAWKALPYCLCWAGCSSYESQLGHQLVWASSEPALAEHPGLLFSLHFFSACSVTICFLGLCSARL